jgi:hypothetical protein
MPSAKHDSRRRREHVRFGTARRVDRAYAGRVKTIMLSEFIDTNRQEIIGRCLAKVATRPTVPGTKPETDHGVPVFLDQLVTALRLGLTSNTEITTTAVFHGRDLLVQGFSVSQVVHEYGDVCQSVTELAVEKDASISAGDFRTLNRCLDDAIAGAVTEYGREREQKRSGAKDETTPGSKRLGVAAYELRTLSHTALVAFEALQTGSVGVGGSTGALLHRSLKALDALLEGSLT